MSDIQTLMRSANPIEDPRTEFGQEDLDALLLLTQRRSGDMDVKEVTTPVTPEKRNNRGWLVAAVAFASVIAVAALAVLLSRPADDVEPAAPTTTLDTPPPTTAGPTTTVIAEATVAAEDQAVIDAYAAAVAAADDSAMRSVLSPAAMRSNDEDATFNADVDQLILEAQIREARGTSVVFENCVPSAERVQCDVVLDGPVERAVFQIPQKERYWFSFDDGQIIDIGVKCVVCGDGGGVGNDLQSWVVTFDPDAAVGMGSIPDLASSVDAAMVWAEYAPLWREGKSSGTLEQLAVGMATVLAYEATSEAGDVEAFRSLFDPGAVRYTANTPDLPTSLDKIVDEAVALHARNSVQNFDECAVVQGGLRCTLVVTGPVESAVYGGRVSGSTTFILDEQGVILEIRSGQLAVDVVTENRFLDWVEATDPDVYEQLLPPGIRELLAYPPADLWLEWSQAWVEAGRP